MSDYDKSDFVNRFVNEVLAHIRAVYQEEVENALRQGGTLPLAEPALRKIKDTIAGEVQKDRARTDGL